MRRSQGVTLLELLVAMAILGTVLSLSLSTVVSGTRGQRLNEASVATQAKLRRVLEVVSQDIRGSVFGTVSNEPYSNTSSSFSLSLIAGGAGYSVLQQGTSLTVNAGTLQFVSDGTPNLGGATLLLNYEGIGAIFTVSNVAKSAGVDNTYQITMRSCGAINYTDNLLLYRISTIGYSYDPASRTIFYRSAGSDTPQPFAYDIDAFNVSYIYVNQTTGAVLERTTPHLLNGIPQKIDKDSVPGVILVLKQLKLRISSTQQVGNRPLTRSFQTTVDLGYSQALNVKEIRACS